MVFSRLRAGQSLIEVLVAIAILALMATGSFGLVGTTVSESGIAVQQANARNLAEEGLEAVRQIRNADFSSLVAGTYGLVLTGSTWTLSGSSDVTDSAFTRTVTITQIDENQRDIRVAVTWTARPGRVLTYTESTRFANWVNAPIPTASNCKSIGAATGDWTHPVLLGSADLGAGNAGTDVVVNWPYVYVSGTASSSAKPDLFVFDATNPASPSLVKTVEAGGDGINALFLLGDYLYAASENGSKEFIIYDVSNPTNPTQVGSADLSGSQDGLSVVAAGTWAVIGREDGSGQEIYVYDVSTPSIPSLVATFDVSGDVNDFASNGPLLFAATSSAAQDIYMIDMADPIHPVFFDSYNISDGTEDLTIAYQDPGTLFVGNASNRVYAIDATDPANMSVISTYNTNGTVQDVLCVIDNLLYTGTNYSTKEFQILNIANLGAMTEFSSLNFPQVATGVDFANNMIFVSVRSNDALRIITSSP